MTLQPTYILDETSSLETFLCSIKNSKIDIAVAFASKTEDLIETMLGNGNLVSLIVGTINHFTDPAFIRHCKKLSDTKQTKLNTFVDFRGDNSIHWKVYLTGSDTVVIGSPNLTSTGISMRRDTAVVIKDGSLRQSYLTKMNSLKRDYQADILHSHHANFERRLQEYERAHRKTFGQILAARFPAVGAKHSPPVDFLEWVTQEKSQVIPLFIWGRKATDKEQEVFNKQVIPIISQGSENIGEFYIVGIYDGSPKKQDYHNGEIILTMKLSGHYIEFDLVDVVIYAQGKWWLCGLQSHIINEPFALTSDLKRIIRQKRYDWAEAQIDAGKMYLDSRDLRELAAALRADRQSSAR